VASDCDALLAGCQNCHLRESINDHEYIVIPMLGCRKTRHVIHGDGFPRPIGSRKRDVHALFLDGGLNNDACSVGSNVLVDILLKLQPIK
jgi:hypothetical protein